MVLVSFIQPETNKTLIKVLGIPVATQLPNRLVYGHQGRLLPLTSRIPRKGWGCLQKTYVQELGRKRTRTHPFFLCTFRDSLNVGPAPQPFMWLQHEAPKVEKKQEIWRFSVFRRKPLLSISTKEGWQAHAKIRHTALCVYPRPEVLLRSNHESCTTPKVSDAVMHFQWVNWYRWRELHTEIFGEIILQHEFKFFELSQSHANLRISFLRG